MNRNFFLRALSPLFSPRCVSCDRLSHASPLCHRCAPPFPASRALQDYCQRCYEFLLPEERGICRLCKEMPRLLNQERFIWDYTSPVAELIVLMKTKPSRPLACWFAKAIGTYAEKHFGNVAIDLVCPLPISRARAAARGFSQSHIFAYAAAKSLRVPWQDSLIHSGRGIPQSEAPLLGRISNIRGKLALSHPSSVAGRCVLLVDDVSTSGATAHSAARLILDAGASAVHLFTLARSSTWRGARNAIYETFVRSSPRMIENSAIPSLER